MVKTYTLSDDEDGDGTGALGDIQPVGHDYVEEVRPYSQNISLFVLTNSWNKTSESVFLSVNQSN